MIAVLFYKNIPPEIVESDKGIRFEVSVLLNQSVDSIYFAKNKTDANHAIEILGKDDASDDNA